MAPSNWQEWIAWAGLALPLVALAWAALWYVSTRRREIRHQEFERFFFVMDKIGQEEGSIASKVAAVYELRKYPQYRDVIIRVCDNSQQHVVGASAQMLVDEMALTAEAMRRNNG